MVFSFFKKAPEKMPERPAARPKPIAPAAPVVTAAPLQAPQKSASLAPPVARSKPLPVMPAKPLAAAARPVAPPPVIKPAAPLAPPRPALKPLPPIDDEDDYSEDLEGFVTVSTIMGIDVRDGVDPMQADIEHVVVMFANGQDALVRSLLEAHIQSYPCPKGRPFWLMLFDFLHIAGDRAAYERLSVEYAKICEMSPPPWRESMSTTVCAVSGVRQLNLKGVLTVDIARPVLAELARLQTAASPVLIDCGQLLGCDDEVAGLLATALRTARQAEQVVNLVAVDHLQQRLDDRLVTGEAAHEASWLLLLELLQRHGSQAHFEERAVDYAITFEVSPPSWEPRQDAAPLEISLPVAETVHYLRGELKNEHFDSLLSVLELQDAPIIDCSELARLDFFSAGQMVNRLSPYRAAGKEVVIRNPNHLVAGLMAVVGVNKQASVILPKS